MRLAYWMYQGTAHHGIGRISNSMRGVHAVFHAPQGDDYVNPIFTMLERSASFPQMTTSVVSGRDLAQGTIRLPETLRQIEARLHPQLMVICATCSTILLQEDLQQVVQTAGVDADLLVYDANPYRMQEIVAAEGLFSALVRRYAAAQPLTARPSVNLLGPASLGFHNRTDLISLRRMLGVLGVQINVIAPWGASIDDLRRLPAAWATLAPYRELGREAAGYLEQQFGIPAIYTTPMGVQPTLAWLRELIELLNDAGQRHRTDSAALRLPPLTAFSLDGISAPSGVPWFARTADMESFSSKSAFVFGDATHSVGMVRFLRDELDMQIVGVGTYLEQEAGWVREQLQGYLHDELLVTDRFQEVAQRIEQLAPSLVCGTQMERHSCRKLDIPCMVIAPPTHIENHLLGYYPILGFDGADYLADKVYTTTQLGLEQHLIELFGDAGLEYSQAPSPLHATPAPAPDASQAAVPSATPVAPTAVQPGAVQWTSEAQAMLKKIPFFVRGRVQKNTEKFAAEHGHSFISVEVLQAAKEALGG